MGIAWNLRLKKLWIWSFKDTGTRSSMKIFKRLVQLCLLRRFSILIVYLLFPKEPYLWRAWNRRPLRFDSILSKSTSSLQVTLVFLGRSYKHHMGLGREYGSHGSLKGELIFLLSLSAGVNISSLIDTSFCSGGPFWVNWRYDTSPLPVGFVWILVHPKRVAHTSKLSTHEGCLIEGPPSVSCFQIDV